MSVKNKLRKKANKFIAKQVSPEVLGDIEKKIKTTRHYNEVSKYALESASKTTSTLEDANSVLNPIGGVAGYVNRPVNTIYNNYIKVWIGENEAIEYTLRQEESTHWTLSLVENTAKASNFATDKQLTKNIKNVVSLLEKLDGYAERVEIWIKHLQNIQQQDIRKQEYDQLNDKRVVTKIIDKFLTDEEIDQLFGLNDIEDMELVDSFDIVSSPAEEKKLEAKRQAELADQQLLIKNWGDTDDSLKNNLKEALTDEMNRPVDVVDEIELDWEGEDWDKIDKEAYEYKESKVWRVLRRVNETALNLNAKVREYSELADMAQKLLEEIDGIKSKIKIKATGWERLDKAIQDKILDKIVLQRLIVPLIKKTSQKGRRFIEWTQSERLVENARDLANVIETYNNKVKRGSELLEKVTDYLGEKIKNKDNWMHSKEYEVLNCRDEDIKVLEEELVSKAEEKVKKEEPKAEVVQDKPKGWLSGWFKK